LPTTAAAVDVAPVQGSQDGVEVDLVHPTASWSVRLTRDRPTGAVVLIAVDHQQGRPGVAEVLRDPEPAR
jgi:hypothetical protein